MRRLSSSTTENLPPPLNSNPLLSRQSYFSLFIPPPLLLSLSFIHWRALSIDTRRVYEVREINGLVGIDCFLKLRSETDQIDYCGIVCLWSERFFFVVSRFWLWEIRSKGFVRYIVKIVFIWANLNVFLNWNFLELDNVMAK